jgi:hypothetical protein
MQGSALAQTDTTRLAKPTLAFTGFVDVFYAYDSHRPQGDARQPFLYNHNRQNRFDLNLGLVRLKLNHAKVRATVALHAGTYVNDNYAAEPEVLRYMWPRPMWAWPLRAKADLWLDVGIMPSHIGFESAISVDNQTLTRSLLAENSPYYLAAAKFTYTLRKNWEVAALVCNGWQRIRPVVGNTLPGFGTQVVWKPKDGLSLNWSTFIGTDDPDTTRRVRFFNNLYAQWQAHKQCGCHGREWTSACSSRPRAARSRTCGSVRWSLRAGPCTPNGLRPCGQSIITMGQGSSLPPRPWRDSARAAYRSMWTMHPCPSCTFGWKAAGWAVPMRISLGSAVAERNVFSVVASLGVQVRAVVLEFASLQVIASLFKRK